MLQFFASILVGIFLFLPIAPADPLLEEGAGDYSKNPGVNPAAPGDRAFGETESNEPPPTAITNVSKKKNAKAKVVFEGVTPGKVEEVGSHSSLQKTLVIRTEFDYTSPKRRARAERSVFLTEEHKDWVGLTQPRDGVVVIGRVISREANQVKLEYLVVDTSREDDAGVINPPVLEAPIGQKLLVNLDGQGTRATLTFEVKWRKD